MEQVVAGKNYRLFYDAPTARYLAIVFDQPWTNTRELTNWTVISKENAGVPATGAAVASPDAQYTVWNPPPSDPNYQRILYKLRKYYNGTEPKITQMLVDATGQNVKVEMEVDGKLMTVAFTKKIDNSANQAQNLIQNQPQISQAQP